MANNQQTFKCRVLIEFKPKGPFNNIMKNKSYHVMTNRITLKLYLSVNYPQKP